MCCHTYTVPIQYLHRISRRPAGLRHLPINLHLSFAGLRMQFPCTDVPPRSAHLVASCQGPGLPSVQGPLDTCKTGNTLCESRSENLNRELLTMHFRACRPLELYISPPSYLTYQLRSFKHAYGISYNFSSFRFYVQLMLT